MSYAVSPSMSDDERDIDIESDEDGESGYSRGSGQYSQQVDKRAHHNALERKRRDHIKDSFSGLRDSVPSLQSEKVTKIHIFYQTDLNDKMSCRMVHASKQAGPRF